MRFLLRSLIGAIIVIALAAGVLSFGVSRMTEAQEKAAIERPSRPAPERIYTVRDMTVEASTVTPVMSAYGTIEAGRILELRAAQPGRIVDLPPSFREGSAIRSGDMLLRVDPATTRSRETEAMNTLADARSRESQAVQAVSLAEAELSAAQQQFNLRREALRRRVDLANRGLVARTAVEADQLALASAEQSVITRRQALANAQKAVEQARLAVQRADNTVSDTRRDVADTATRAPFSGVLSETNAVLGRLVGTSETLGRLIDLSSLEVAFRVSDSQFARLLDERGELLPLKARASLSLGERTITAEAVLVRIAAVTGAEGGRTVYATLVADERTPLRPGDFVSVAVTEPPLFRVAEIPARAATEDGVIYVIGEDNRLEEVRVRILRRMADTLVVADAPFDRRIVAELRPQLGPGIRVQNAAEAKIAQEEAEKKAAARRAGAGGGRPGGGGRPEGGKPEGAKPEGAKPEGGRPEGGRPEGGKPPGAGRPEGAGSGGGRPEGAGERPASGQPTTPSNGASG